MANQPRTGLSRLYHATRCSWAGLKVCWRNEQAFRQEVAAGVVLLPLALWLGADGVERALLGASLMLVLIAELANSALEAVVDRIGPERHELSARAKDIGSALVMVALVNVALVWGLILLT
ncbi:MAG: diacylglycerol kinase [Candidatus Competibacterales bacterium]|nr:diacylglycerol kinase [Candidatus Competibacterales bacterium]